MALKNVGNPSERFRKVQDEVGLSNAEMARRLMLSETYISDIRNGRDPVSPKTADNVERAFGYRKNWLLAGKGPPRKPDWLPEQAAPTDATRVAEQSVSRVQPRTAYHCELCRKEVAAGLVVCPHCGAALIWPQTSD